MQNADGQAHLAYFDVRTQASFVWDGASDVIEVSIGGYGEPVDHTIEVGQTFNATRAPILMRLFAEYCASHAATLPTY